MWLTDWIKTWNEKRVARRALRTMGLVEILTSRDNLPEWWEELMMEEIVLNRRSPIDKLGVLAVSGLPCASSALEVMLAILTAEIPHVESPRDRRGWPTSWAVYRCETLVDLVLSLGYESEAARFVLSTAGDRLPHYQLQRLYADLNDQLARQLPMRLLELHFILYEYDPDEWDDDPYR